MRKNRPVNLALTTITFPPMAIVSILHRLSGLLLFVLIPFMLYLLHQSLLSAESFEKIKLLLSHWLVKGTVFAFVAALLYHLLAGIRHMLMDLGIGEQLESGRRSAWLLLVVALIVIGGAGVWLW